MHLRACTCALFRTGNYRVTGGGSCLKDLDRWLNLQRVNLFQYCLQPVFQLFLRPGLNFGPRELGVIRQGTTVKIGGFGQ